MSIRYFNKIIAYIICINIIISINLGFSLQIASAGTIFRDDFENTTLNDAWEIVREDSTHWSLSASPGALQILTQRCDFWTWPRPYNLFLVDPQTDYNILETRLTFNPSQNFQQAGLLIYVNDENFIKFVRAYSNGSNVFEFYHRLNNGDDPENPRITTGNLLLPLSLYLRITKKVTIIQPATAVTGLTIQRLVQ